MPDQPSWLARVPALEDALAAASAPGLFDRSAIETLFGVRRRQAISLLHHCQGYRKGRKLVATRESVLGLLAAARAGGAWEELAEQRRQVAEFLGEARHGLTLPTLRIPAPARLSEITFAGLPPGIHLMPGQLSVRFDTAEDLVEKLFTLGQALANDYESLEAALAGTEGSQDHHGSG